MNQFCISNVLDSKDLFELADNLEYFIQQIQRESNKKKLLFNLYRHLTDATVILDISPPPFHILSHQRSVLFYLKNYWIFQDSSKENINVLTRIIKEIRNSILKPQKPIIDDKKIKELLLFTEKRFSFITNVVQNHPIQILCLNHSHKNCNSYYSARLSSDGKIEDRVFITSSERNVDFPKEFVFLHELGHLLHTRITKSLMTVPKSFCMIQERMFQKGLDDVSEKTAELFADCFGISVLYNSEYEHLNPYKNIHNDDNIYLTMYMVSLIGSMKR